MFNRRDFVMTALGSGSGGLASLSPESAPAADLPRLPTGESATLARFVLPHGLAIVDEFGVLHIGDGTTAGGRRALDAEAVQTLGPAPWSGAIPAPTIHAPSEDPAVQALVGAAVANGAPLLLRPGQTAYIDVGPKESGGMLPFSRLQDAVAFQAAWGGAPAVVIRLTPGKHVLTQGIRCAHDVLTRIDGARGADGKLWRTVQIVGGSIAAVGPVNPALRNGLQNLVMTVRVNDLSGVAPGWLVRLMPVSAPGETLDQRETADNLAGVFRVQSVDAVARTFTVHGRSYGRTEFPAFAVSGECRIFHSVVEAPSTWRGGAFVIGDDVTVGPPQRMELNLAIDLTTSTESSVAVLVFYGGALTWAPYSLNVSGGVRSGIWNVAGTVHGFGLCVSHARVCLQNQQGFVSNTYRATLTHAFEYALIGSGGGNIVASQSQYHGGSGAAVFADTAYVWIPGARAHGARHPLFAQEQGRIDAEGLAANAGRDSYVRPPPGGYSARILGMGATGSSLLKIDGNTTFIAERPDISVEGGGLMLGANAADFTGVTPGVVTKWGGYIRTIRDMPEAGPEALVYVHQASGDDATGDGSSSRPFRSIRQAFRAAIGPVLHIGLMTDYLRGANELEASLPNFLSHVRIFGSSGSGALTTRALTLTNWLPPDAPTTYGAGFLAVPPSAGPIHVDFQRLTISFPAPPGGGRATRAYQDGLVTRTASTLGPSLLSVSLSHGEIIRAAGSTGCVVASVYRKRAVLVDAMTYDGAACAGKWIAGVAAGAAPNGNMVESNLATL